MEAVATFYYPLKALQGDLHPGGDTTKVLNADKTNTWLFVLQQILCSIINIHLNLTWLGFFFLSSLTMTVGSRTFWKRRLLLGLGTYVRSETFGSSLTLSKRDGGVFLLHCFMTHHVSMLSSSVCSILFSFLPSAPHYLPLQHTRHGPAVWTVGLSQQLTGVIHTNNLPYKKQTFCYCWCKKQNEGAMQNHKRFWFDFWGVWMETSRTRQQPLLNLGGPFCCSDSSGSLMPL